MPFPNPDPSPSHPASPPPPTLHPMPHHARLLLAALLAALLARADVAPAPQRTFTVLAYNVENLFDVDRVARFDDYVEKPGDPNGYGPAKLARKLEGIGRVLGAVGNGAGPDVLIACELEIDFTPESGVPDISRFLADHRDTPAVQLLTQGLPDALRGVPSEAWLVKHLADIGLRGYAVVVGQDFPDPSGRDDIAHKNVILSRLPVVSSTTHRTAGARGIVEAVLEVEGQRVHVFANHWKSGASAPAAEETRVGNARVLRQRLDQILKANPNAQVIIGGDLNAHYNQNQRYPHLPRTGIQDVLGSQGSKPATSRPNGPALYNLWHELPPRDRRSDEFSGEWGTLMHLIVSRGLLDGSGVEFIDGSFRPLILPGTNAQPPLNLPWRWTSHGAGAGTSDHFPLLASFALSPKPAQRFLAQPDGLDQAPPDALKVGFDAIDRSRLRNASVLANASPEDLARAIGEIFLVDATVSTGRPFEVSVNGRRFLLHSFDRALKDSLRAWKPGEKVRFVGELGTFKGNLQFVIQDPSWKP